MLTILESADATICPAIALGNGQVIPAIPDSELIGMFNWETWDAETGTGTVKRATPGVDGDADECAREDWLTRSNRYGSTGFDRDADRVDPLEDTASDERKDRVGMLAALYAEGEFSGFSVDKLTRKAGDNAELEELLD